MNTDVKTTPLAMLTVPKRARMAGLYALKPWFTRLLTPVLEAAVARRISPGMFTAAGVVAAGAAGVAVAYGCWP
jgi:CDP-diacylglycerol---glycerol-3-phosphate 3-phosphatidyltransferase